MVPLVAETRRILLDAAPASVPDPVVRYLLVTDLVNSTGLNAAVGDARWVEVMGEHDRVVRAALVRRGGVQFKHTGDGVCAWFTSASAAVRCALDMQEGLDEANVIHPDVALVIRAGVADGRPIGEAGDLFGLDVALVSRVCQVATGRQVLVTGPVALDAAATGLTVRRVGRFELKGFAEPVVLHEAMSVTKITTRGPVR
jgi:class 3 adenylate cyclase